MKSLDHIPAVAWGKVNEATALEEYAVTMATIHKDFKRQPTGLLIYDKLPFLAASADSLALCSCHGRRVVEVKCPFSHKESTLEEYIKDPTSCLTQDGKALKDNHKYYSQVQLQLFVHNVETCDLVVYTLRMTAILPISRDNDFISRMTDRVKVFYLNCVMPELLTRRLKHSAVTLYNSVTDHRFYCLCHSKDDGKADMIGCDKTKCKIQISKPNGD
jgi:hypothetical protein